MTLLEVENLNVHYGRSHVIQGVSMTVETGAGVALLGRNGAGKTTTLKAIAGVLRASSGRIVLAGEEITHLRPHETVRRGIAWVPEERRIFRTLTVYENLKISRLMIDGGRRMDEFLDRVFLLFPRLKERLGNKGWQLSGGEQRMLAIARALGSEPKLLLLDEPSEGLAPAVVAAIRETIARVQEQGVATILVEQNTAIALSACRSVYLIEKGVIKFHGASQDLARDHETRLRYLGV